MKIAPILVFCALFLVLCSFSPSLKITVGTPSREVIRLIDATPDEVREASRACRAKPGRVWMSIKQPVDGEPKMEFSCFVEEENEE